MGSRIIRPSSSLDSCDPGAGHVPSASPPQEGTCLIASCSSPMDPFKLCDCAHASSRPKQPQLPHPLCPTLLQSLTSHTAGCCTRSWKGAQLGQLTPTEHRDIPYLMAPCSAHKTRGRGRKGNDIPSDGIGLPKSLLCLLELCFLGWWNTCLHIGNGE